MSIPFRERNPVPIGAAGLTVIAVLLVLAFNIGNLPLLGGGRHYSAAFSEAGGLIKGDDVRIAGVKVGKVEKVDLAGDHVLVDFKVTEPARFGTQTGASVRMKTLLGQKYLALEPGGTGQLRADSQIPLDRTVSSYDIVNAFTDLATTSERIDTDELAKSLTTLATEFKDSPADVRAALDGLGRLSRTIASRDAQLKQLLASANSVSGTVAQRNKAVESIIKNADLLMVELNARKDAIHTLFTNTSAMAQQITGLVRDNRAELKPALDQLTKVLATLQKHEQDLSDTIAAMAPFTRLFANVLGNGRWFDTYIANLTTPVAAPGGGN
jgi:phospholipid/cholesterol/gamma-HCH transport system substrate-binding protein